MALTEKRILKYYHLASDELLENFEEEEQKRKAILPKMTLAKTMMLKGFNSEDVIYVTGLSLEEIKNLLN